MSLKEAEEEDWLEVTDAIRRLGCMDVDAETEHMETVVPRGSDPQVTRVQIKHQTVHFPPMAIGLNDTAAGPEDEHPPKS